jgi:hypothetical protein
MISYRALEDDVCVYVEGGKLRTLKHESSSAQNEEDRRRCIYYGRVAYAIYAQTALTCREMNSSCTNVFYGILVLHRRLDIQRKKSYIIGKKGAS